MDTYIVRQPIVDKSRSVVAYEILYKEDVNSLYMRDDESAKVASAIEQFLTNMDGEKFLGGKKAFFTFTPNLLMKNIPKMFPSNKWSSKSTIPRSFTPLRRRSSTASKSRGTTWR